jgi:hypothetical protein
VYHQNEDIQDITKQRKSQDIEEGGFLIFSRVLYGIPTSWFDVGFAINRGGGTPHWASVLLSQYTGWPVSALREHLIAWGELVAFCHEYLHLRH